VLANIIVWQKSRKLSFNRNKNESKISLCLTFEPIKNILFIHNILWTAIHLLFDIHICNMKIYFLLIEIGLANTSLMIMIHFVVSQKKRFTNFHVRVWEGDEITKSSSVDSYPLFSRGNDQFESPVLQL